MVENKKGRVSVYGWQFPTHYTEITVLTMGKLSLNLKWADLALCPNNTDSHPPNQPHIQPPTPDKYDIMNLTLIVIGPI